MPSIFNLSIPQLRQWSRRQLPDHRRLNEPVEAINRMTTGISPPRVKAGMSIAVAGAAGIAQFRLKRYAGEFDDYFVCRTWDGETEGADEIFVAKPWLLRQTTFDGLWRGSIRYAYPYQNSVERDAIRGAATEHQMIIPEFRNNDIIYASEGITGGTGVIVGDTIVTWLAHSDGRAWAWIVPES